jgi:hypothetical protein
MEIVIASYSYLSALVGKGIAFYCYLLLKGIGD